MTAKTAEPEPAATEEVDVRTAETIAPGPGRVQIDALHHEYSGTVAVASLDLVVEPGEFITLLGPSGSGKSTVLHIVAGLQSATRGRVLIDDVDITPLPPQRRNIGLVFQNYALFPHLTAADNVRFPLSVRKAESGEAARRVEEILALVELAALGSRLPSQLSGGQQQRVAIARALAPLPRVLLLDEPLGALDRRLRQQLGRELRRIQRTTGVTTIYVTHDQDEAFAMSDRIAVMDHGRLKQVGTPEEIYLSPKDLFVAGFVGEVSPLEGQVTSADGTQVIVDLAVGARVGVANSSGLKRGDRVVCIVRPEQIAVWAPGASAPAGVVEIGCARILDSVFMGTVRQLELEIRGVALTVRLPASHDIAPAMDTVRFGWDPGDAAVFAAQE